MAIPPNVVIEECRRLRKTIQPISDKYHGFLDKSNCHNTLFPFVLLLGNHSSGKSSFINHLLERKVQTTGVAPTDDNFTIIGPGDEDIDRNGPALVGDPDLGFNALQQFGPVLVNHTQLKVRADTAIKDFMIVDSPGMIDSPVTKRNAGGPVGVDRGYNFEGVVRWYAERADVILLFFDPDKPGTTGETLSILTTSLVGLDHKMYIILNKADQFHKIHDFARAYGSLCWNISKVIPRKDLPRIHTMCLPVKNKGGPAPVTNGAGTEQAGKTTKRTKSFFDNGIHDLEESRAEVIRETMNAPRRRVDNEISRLTESVSSLTMHCRIVDRVVELYRSRLWRARLLTVLSGIATVGLTIGISYLWDAIAAATATAATSSPYGAGEFLTESSADPSDLTTVPSSSGATTGGAQAASTPSRSRSFFSMFGGGSQPPPQNRAERASSTPVAGDVAATVAAAAAAGVLNGTTPPPRNFLRSLFALDSKRSVLFVIATGGSAVSGALSLWEYMSVARLLKSFAGREALERIYRDLYSKELKSHDEFTMAMGKLVLNELPGNLTAERIAAAHRVNREDFQALQRIFEDDIATLRRRVSPSFPVLSPTRSADPLFEMDQEQYQLEQATQDSLSLMELSEAAGRGGTHQQRSNFSEEDDSSLSYEEIIRKSNAASAGAAAVRVSYGHSVEDAAISGGMALSGAVPSPSGGGLQTYFSPSIHARSSPSSRVGSTGDMGFYGDSGNGQSHIAYTNVSNGYGNGSVASNGANGSYHSGSGSIYSDGGGPSPAAASRSGAGGFGFPGGSCIDRSASSTGRSSRSERGLLPAEHKASGVELSGTTGTPTTITAASSPASVHPCPRSPHSDSPYGSSGKGSYTQSLSSPAHQVVGAGVASSSRSSSDGTASLQYSPDSFITPDCKSQHRRSVSQQHTVSTEMTGDHHDHHGHLENKSNTELMHFSHSQQQQGDNASSSHSIGSKSAVETSTEAYFAACNPMDNMLLT